MQVGDLVRVKFPNPTLVGIVTATIQYGSLPSKFAKVALPNGYVATYRFDNLEVICK